VLSQGHGTVCCVFWQRWDPSGKLLLFEKRSKNFPTAPTERRILQPPCAAPLAKVFGSFLKKNASFVFIVQRLA
jgi:hypothetical protein